MNFTGLALTLTLGVLGAFGGTPHFGWPHWDLPRWGWPVAPSHVIVRPFIAPASAYAAGHRGIDIAAASGAAVYAPDSGVVFFAGVVVDRPVLSISYPGGIVSSFEPVTTTLTAGTAVHRGQQVGTLVAGHCDSPCLHFGVRLHGEYVSPLLSLDGIVHPVLLPTRALPTGRSP
jgi:murein DD-endopeptidase MepM/ murein hydrolase activator NlpD